MKKHIEIILYMFILCSIGYSEVMTGIFTLSQIPERNETNEIDFSKLLDACPSHYFSIKTSEDNYAILIDIGVYVGPITKWFFFWAYQDDGSKNFSPLSTINIGKPEIAYNFNIFPNPFKNTIRLNINGNSSTSFSIYNLSGKEIYSAKPKTIITWDGRDNTGKHVPSGTYLLRIITDKEIRTRKITLIR